MRSTETLADLSIPTPTHLLSLLTVDIRECMFYYGILLLCVFLLKLTCHCLPLPFSSPSPKLPNPSYLFVADLLYVAVRRSCVVDLYSVLCIIGSDVAVQWAMQWEVVNFVGTGLADMLSVEWLWSYCCYLLSAAWQIVLRQ